MRGKYGSEHSACVREFHLRSALYLHEAVRNPRRDAPQGEKEGYHEDASPVEEKKLHKQVILHTVVAATGVGVQL